MIEDMLRQNWSTLHRYSIDLKYSAKAARSQSKAKAPKALDRPAAILAPMSQHARRGVFHFRGAFLNSFKHIVHNSITPNGMKGECFFPFHSSTRVKTLA